MCVGDTRLVKEGKLVLEMRTDSEHSIGIVLEKEGRCFFCGGLSAES